jgi:CBS domain-containing protein
MKQPTSPAPSLIANLLRELQRYAPFAQMAAEAVTSFITQAQQRYFAPQDVVIEPASGVVQEIYFIRQGAVASLRGSADQPQAAFQYEAGDLFPLHAAVSQRAATTRYVATQDTFVLALQVPAMQALAAQSPAFAHFLNGRIGQFLALSRQAVQADYSSQALAEHSLETPLGDLIRVAPEWCAPDTTLRDALRRIHDRRIGSMLVADEHCHPLGILTRHDVVDRVALAQVPLDAPIAQVMVQPVHCLTTAHTAQDAVLLMSRRSIRHVPVTRDGCLAGVLSERDLFALQRLSLKQLSAALRNAPDLPALQALARDIRRFARTLLGQGVQARQLTALISHLNDVLTERLLAIKAAAHDIDLSRLCWLALGSEGRSEQTIATDQDNALILPDGSTPAQLEAARVFAHDVNLALDACGFPLCKGGIMAGEPGCCLSLPQWRERFAYWVEHGAPTDLLQASIYFDFRALAGDSSLATALRAEIAHAARHTPRFLKQLALNTLNRSAPLNWLGSVDTDTEGAVDLKLQGAALFADSARLYALAHGVAATNTRERLEQAGQLMGVPRHEFEAWKGAFEFLQMLRLHLQLDAQPGAGDAPNRLVVATLNDIDRRILKESFRVARSLQQRLQLDYGR